MVQRTIEVNVTGERDIERVSRKISELRDKLVNLTKELGGLNNSSFSFKVKMDASDFYDEYSKLAKKLKDTEKTEVELKAKGFDELAKSSKSSVDSLKSIREAVKNASDSIDNLSGSNLNRFEERFRNLGRTVNGSLSEISRNMREAFSGDLTSGVRNQLIYFRRNILGRLSNDLSLRASSSQLGFDGQAGLPITDRGNIEYNLNSLRHVTQSLVYSNELSDELKKNIRDVFREMNRNGNVWDDFNQGQATAVNGITDLLNALHTISDALDGVNRAMVSFVSTVGRLGFINPFRAYLGGFRSVVSGILQANRTMATSVGNTLRGVLSGAFTSIRQTGVSALRTLYEEAKTTGDAMNSYRSSMQALGRETDEINRTMKQMADYGRRTIFNVGDLLELSGQYASYGFDEGQVSNLTRAMAGLVAGRSDANQAIEGANRQLIQAFSRGYAERGDINIMRQWFSAIGTSKFNDALDVIASEKGFNNINDAIRKHSLTTDDLYDAITRVGLSEELQGLVSQIVTPAQGIEALRESLSSLLAFDRIEVNEDGTTTTRAGALGSLYSSVARAISGLVDVVDSERFVRAVESFGSDASRLVDGVVSFGTRFRERFGNAFLRSFNLLYTSLVRFTDFRGVSPALDRISQSLIAFNNSVAIPLSQSIPRVITEGLGFVDMLIDLGNAFVSAGLLRAVSEIIEAYQRLGRLAITTGGVDLFVSTVEGFFSSINSILSDAGNVGALRRTVSQAKDFVSEFMTALRFLGTDTNLIPNALRVVEGVISSFGNVIRTVRVTVGASRFNAIFDSLRRHLLTIVNGMSEIAGTLLSSALRALDSGAGERFFKAVSNFVLTIGRSVRDAVASFGFGSVDLGMRNLLRFFSVALDTAASIANFIGRHASIFLGIAGLLAFGKFALAVISTITSISSALSAFGATSVGGGIARGLGLGSRVAGNVAGSTSATAGVTANASNFTPFFTGLSNTIRGGLANLGARWAGQVGDGAKVLGFRAVAENMQNVGLKSTALGNKFANIGQTMASLTPKLVNFAKGVALLGVPLVSGHINNRVQNSNLGDGFKKLSNVANSAIQGGATGFAVGSFVPAIGNLVGGVSGAILGAIKGLFDNRSISNASRQAVEQARAERSAIGEDFVNYAKQLGEASRNIQSQYFSSLTRSFDTDLSSTLGYIQSQAQQSGSSIETALRSLGVSAVKVPNNIKDAYVRINDQLVSWSDLESQTGLKGQELLGVLQLMYASWGESFVPLLDSTGNVIEQIATLTESERARREENVEQVRQALEDLGIHSDQLEKLTYENIVGLNQALEEALQGSNFTSVEDQREALAEAISEHTGVAKSELLKHDLATLRSMSETLKEETERATQTTQERHAELLEEYKKILESNDKITANGMKKRMEEAGRLTLEELENLIATEGNASKEVMRESAQKLFEDVVLMLEKGAITMNDAKEILSGVDMSLIDTSEVGKKGQELYNEVDKSQKGAGSKLKEAGGLAKVDFAGINLSGITSAGVVLFNAVQGLANRTAQKVAEIAAEARRRTVENINSGIETRGNSNPNASAATRRMNTFFRSQGGIIPEYRNFGGFINWRSRGTDTVPTMLTPGEFVLRKEAVDSVGVGLLRQLNNHGARALENHVTNRSTVVNNVYHNNNAKLTQNVDNKAQYLNGMSGVDRLMRYV